MARAEQQENLEREMASRFGWDSVPAAAARHGVLREVDPRVPPHRAKDWAPALVDGEPVLMKRSEKA